MTCCKLLAQVFRPDARHAAEAEEPRRLDPHGAVEDEIVLADGIGACGFVAPMLCRGQGQE